MKKFLKQLYVLLPFKRSIFTLLKAVWVPPQRIYQHLYFKDAMTVKINDRKSFKMQHYGFPLENDVFWRGLQNGWEKTSIEAWIALCKSSDVIFDIGANTGIYALIAQTLRPEAKVYAFEPVQRIYEKLVHNCQLNNFGVKCEPVALSNEDGTAFIFDPIAEHTYSVTVNKNLHEENTNVCKTTINTVKLSSYIRQHNISKIDLMKIDVETHEPEVLEGMEEFLDKFRPAMIIEIISVELAARIETLLAGKGYIYFNIDEKTPPRRVAKLTQSDHYNFLICSEQTARKIGLLS